MSQTFAFKAAASLFQRIERIFVTKFAQGESTCADATHDPVALAMTYGAFEAETRTADRWISRARPTFLYVIYAMILWALPMGLIAAISPRISRAITIGMTDYLSALPAELYTLFATGYLGYATLRQWGKAKGTDR